jgi:AraC family transcriptional regulator of arabinose operon
MVGSGGMMFGSGPFPWKWEVTVYDYIFWFLIRGEGRLRCEDRDYRLSPGSCFLFTPGMRVHGRSTSQEPFLNFAAHFFPVRPGKISGNMLHRLLGRKSRRMAFFLELARHCTETFQRGDVLGIRQAELAALQMMLQLWREVDSPMPRGEDEKIRLLLAEEGSHLREPIPDLARRAGLSPSQFTRRVRAMTGMAPREYFIRQRISHACGLLTEMSRPVGEIAEILGYIDVSYFVRQFQTVMRTTPTRFRRQPRAASELPGPLGVFTLGQTAAEKKTI